MDKQIATLEKLVAEWLADAANLRRTGVNAPWFDQGQASSLERCADNLRAAIALMRGQSEARNRAINELMDAARMATGYVVTHVLEHCDGNKCRESWCIGCCGEEVAENTVIASRAALIRLRAALGSPALLNTEGEKL